MALPLAPDELYLGRRWQRAPALHGKDPGLGGGERLRRRRRWILEADPLEQRRSVLGRAQPVEQAPARVAVDQLDADALAQASHFAVRVRDDASLVDRPVEGEQERLAFVDPRVAVLGARQQHLRCAGVEGEPVRARERPAVQ